MPPHILFDISAHGLGHLAQSAPVITALKKMRPDALISIRSGLSREMLCRRIDAPFEHLETIDDFGLCMTSSFVVDRDVTRARYIELHRRFDRTIGELSAMMIAAGADLVVSNVGYLALGAAARAGLPSLAFSSINWHDVVRHYCGAEGEMARVLGDMAAIYRGAGGFLRLMPGTAMAEFGTIEVPELIVAVGRQRREELCRRLAVDPKSLIVAFSFTEQETQEPPRMEAAPGIVCIGPSHWATAAPWHEIEATGMSFLDLIATVDLIVAKPGYGIVTEAAIAGTPTLLVPRDDWPETRMTSRWYQQHGRFETTRSALHEVRAIDLMTAWGRLAAKDSGPKPSTSGAARVAGEIARRLL